MGEGPDGDTQTGGYKTRPDFQNVPCQRRDCVVVVMGHRPERDSSFGFLCVTGHVPLRDATVKHNQ